MKKRFLIYQVIFSFVILFFATDCKKDDSTTSSIPITVTDADGNLYNTVTIGTQVWMQKNLKTTKYSNGDAIPNVTDATAWISLETGAYCWFRNDSATYKDDYGALYNWFAAADIRNVCPTGWHVPSDAEWTTLTTYLNGDSVAAGKLKETGTNHWRTPNTGATNVTGFTALPGGERDIAGTFDSWTGWGHWWSSTEVSTANAYLRYMVFRDSNVGTANTYKSNGFSVRCLKD